MGLVLFLVLWLFVVFARWESSVILFLIPLVLIRRIFRFLSLGGFCLDAELLWEELEDWEELVGDEWLSLSVVDCESVLVEGGVVALESELSFSVEVEEVDVVDWSCSEDWLSVEVSWSRWRLQWKDWSYSLSRIPEHLRWIQCFDLVLHCIDVWRLLIMRWQIRQM